ncbi:hypothetical protein AB0H26_48940 [Streptomyces milbemycinicus]
MPDSKTLPAVHHALQQRGLLPDEHYPDSGYATAELIHGSVKTYGIALITPVLLDTSRQAKAQAGFAATDFTIDREAGKATCPAGHTSATWNPVVSEGIPKTVVSFAALDRIPCPFQARGQRPPLCDRQVAALTESSTLRRLLQTRVLGGLINEYRYAA